MLSIRVPVLASCSSQPHPHPPTTEAPNCKSLTCNSSGSHLKADAAPGSFLRMANEVNASAETGPAGAAWQQLQVLHPGVSLQELGPVLLSVWVSVLELQVRPTFPEAA